MRHTNGWMKSGARLRWSLVLACIFLLAGCPDANHRSADVPAVKEGPLLVIDAGSTGTRLYAYQVTASPDGGLPGIVLMDSFKVEPGISDLEEDRDQGMKNLEALVEAARRFVPQTRWSTTPVYLLATAGMRLLSRAKQARILAAIDSYFRQEGSFAYQEPIVLSGTYEGLYSWLSVNYLDDRFDPGTEREGMLEMGGASTQIVFLSPPTSAAPVIKRRLRGRAYRIYAHSYLYMGENQARQLAATADCYPGGFPMGIGEAVGQGDFNRCTQEIKEHFAALCENLECDGPHCVFARHPVQAPRGNYFAISGFYFLYDFLNPGNDEKLLATYLAGGRDFCSQNWEAIKAQYAKTPDVYRYLKNYCFASAYYYTLLSSGFGLDDATQNIKAVTQINATEVSWTLGAALDIVSGHAPQSD